MEKIFDLILNKLEKIEDRLDSTEKQLIIYNAELNRHIEGVELAREQNRLLKEYVDKELEPLSVVKAVFTFFRLTYKVLLFLIAAISIVAAVAKFF